MTWGKVVKSTTTVMQVASKSKKMGTPITSSVRGITTITQPIGHPPRSVAARSVEFALYVTADADQRDDPHQGEADENRGMRVDERDAGSHAHFARSEVEGENPSGLRHDEGRTRHGEERGQDAEKGPIP